MSAVMNIKGTRDIGRRISSFIIKLSTINIEVGVHKAQASDAVRGFPALHMFHRHEDGKHAKISRPNWCDVCGRIVDASEIIKGYEIGKDKWIYVSDEELKAIKEGFESKTFQVLAVTRFDHRLKPEEVMETYILSPVPQKRKKDDELNKKLYALLADNLQAGDYAVVGKMFTSRGGEIFTAITGELIGGVPYLYMYSLYYADELKNPETMGLSPIPLSDKEKKLMSQLVEKEIRPLDYQVISSQLKEVFEKLISTRGEGALPPETPVEMPTESAETALERALGLASPKTDTNARIIGCLGGLALAVVFLLLKR